MLIGSILEQNNQLNALNTVKRGALWGCSGSGDTCIKIWNDAAKIPLFQPNVGGINFSLPGENVGEDDEASAP